MAAANATGGLPSLLAPNPEQIAGLTPAEISNIGQLENIAGYGSTGENAAMNQLNQLTSGPIGSSPATQAGMRALNQNVLPTVQSALSATGGGRGGALEAALAQAQVTGDVPLLQQEIQNRMTAAPEFAALGAQQSGDIQTAMNASDLQRQIQQSQLSANFADLQRRQALIQNLTQGPLEMLGGNAIGSRSFGSQSSGQGKF